MSAIANRLESLGIESLGGAPPVAHPTTVEQLSELLAVANQMDWRLLPIGNRTLCDKWHDTPSFDLLVSTASLESSIQYDPGEGVISASAGMAWSALQEQATEQGQSLSPRLGPVADPQMERSVGGVISAGISGLDREFAGALRHQVLGIDVLLADGTRAKAGGRLVKNVTGFDLPRLFAGSRGALGFILNVHLRVSPTPAEQLVFVLPSLDIQEALHQCERFRSEAIPGTTLHWEHQPEQESVQLQVLSQGTIGAMQDTRRAVIRSVEVHDTLTGEMAAERIARLRADWSFSKRTTEKTQAALLIYCLPSQWTSVLKSLEFGQEECCVRGLPGVSEARVEWSPMASQRTPDAETYARRIQLLEKSGCSWSWLRSEELPYRSGTPGNSPALLAATESVRRQFDPLDRFRCRTVTEIPITDGTGASPIQ